MLGKEPGLVDVDLEAAGVKPDKATNAQLAMAKVAARECVLAIGLLTGSDCTHYGKLLEDLENDFTQGWDNYPAMVQHAYRLLVHWKQDPCNIIWLIGGTNDRMAFMNIGSKDSAQSSSNRGWQQQQWCYNCNEVRHISSDSPKCAKGTDTIPTQLLMQVMEDLVMDDSYQFAQHNGHLPTSWILLDTGSTINIFLNRSLLKNVQHMNHYTWIRCDAGWFYTNQMGELPGYPGKIWYNPKGIANILSMADVCRHFCVCFNSVTEQVFLIEEPNGSTKHFVQLKAGLYYHDTAIKDTPLTYDGIHGM